MRRRRRNEEREKGGRERKEENGPPLDLSFVLALDTLLSKPSLLSMIPLCRYFWSLEHLGLPSRTSHSRSAGNYTIVASGSIKEELSTLELLARSRPPSLSALPIERCLSMQLAMKTKSRSLRLSHVLSKCLDVTSKRQTHLIDMFVARLGRISSSPVATALFYISLTPSF